MKTDSIANRLFMERCFHSDCELRNWYDDGLDLAHAQITEPIVASTTGEAETEVRGCECNDVRDMRPIQLPLFRTQIETPFHYHGTGIGHGRPALSGTP